MLEGIDSAEEYEWMRLSQSKLHRPGYVMCKNLNITIPTIRYRKMDTSTRLQLQYSKTQISTEL